MPSTNDRKLRVRAGKVRTRKVRARDADPRKSAGGSNGVLYLQILNSLKDEIVKGVYPVGSQLPTEEELCDRFSVSRYTVREALRRFPDDRPVPPPPRAPTTVLPPSSVGSH